MENERFHAQQQAPQQLEVPAPVTMTDSNAIAEAENHDGAYLENQITVGLGVCYEYSCMCFAACGCNVNLFTIPEGSVGLVLQFGKYVRTLPPGRHRFNVMAEQVIPVSLKTVCLDIPPQAVMTKDNLTVSIDAVCYYQVYDAERAMFAIERYNFALGNLAQVTLRTVLGENTLAEIFAERQKLNGRLQELIDEASDPWGIKVSLVEIKAIEIDEKMRRAMAAKAEAQQEAEAKVIQAAAQRDAASILAEAAEKMSEEPGALKLQWFETLRVICTQGKNSTIIVPHNMDSVGGIAARAMSPQLH